MAKLNLKYCIKDIDDSEDKTSFTMLYNIVKEGRTINNLKEAEWNYPILFHLSNVRENILNWYEFKPQSTILEVGSECGALTGLLCQKGKRVVSIEPSRSKAQINYMRNKAYDNLEIIVADVNEFRCGERYDYIVVNGGSDYISSSGDTDEIYKMILQYCAEHLKSDGRMLFITDNRLATKYFSGKPNEYTNNYFSQINDKDICNTHAISKNELISICKAVGMKCTKFYYPYPDYRFPSEIFTDDTINSNMYGKNYIQFEERRIDLLNEHKLIETLKKEECADVFANSFLVEIRKEAGYRGEKDIKYVKLNSDRKEEFRISTIIYNIRGEKWVGKQALNEKSKNHILQMYNYGKTNHGNTWITQEPYLDVETSCLSYRWIEDDSYDKLVEKCIAEQNIAGIEEILLRVKDIFLNEAEEVQPYQNEDFLKIFAGDIDINGAEVFSCIPSGNIDIIMSNIFEKEEKPCVIDYEWNFNFPIPVEYIMWRVVDALYREHEELAEVITIDELQKTVGVTTDHLKLFRHWEDNFVSNYVGSNSLLCIAKGMIELDMKSLVDQRIAKTADMKLYIDQGDGFTENNCLEKRVDISQGAFELEYLIEGMTWTQLRFDPADYACEVMDIKAQNEGLELGMVAVNAYKQDGVDVFLNSDPNYLVMPDHKESIDKIKITGHMKLLSEQEMNELQMKVLIEEQEKSTQVEQLGVQMQLKDQRIGNLESIIGSERQEKEKLIDEKEKLIDENIKITEERKKLIQEIEEIKSSRLYKLYEVRDRIKQNS